MHCTHCGLWELAQGDLVCSWCGTSYLRFRVVVDPSEVSAQDYPPPVALRVHNDSPLGTVTLERIEAGPPWITLLPEASLPQTLAPGAEHRFYLDVDTFAAGDQNEAIITVSASYATESQMATLHLQHPVPPAA